MTILEAARIVAVMLSPMVPGVSGKVYQKKKRSPAKKKTLILIHIYTGVPGAGCAEVSAYLEVSEGSPATKKY
jgi:hypothetical protein